jgi:glutathione S-transferase
MISAFPALVIGLSLLLYVGEIVAVSRARVRYGIKAPVVSGSAEFERAFRVQQNTLEQLIWFIPSLWLFTVFVSSLWAGLIGLMWVAARAHYAVSYCRDPETRGPGYTIAFVCAAALLVGALVAIVARLL